ncbi:MAG: hypothetical protein CHACPFDD_02390 [Phycisphaerae bacterium]|nr:hypothetical protein [Phycisphaerae bacterium]
MYKFILAGLVPTLLLTGCTGGTGRETRTSTPQNDGTPQPPAAPPPPVAYALSTRGLPIEGNWKCDPVFVDINKDGAMDLVATLRLGSNGPHVWFGDGAGGWKSAATGLDIGQQVCGGGVAVGDVNNDGHLDIAVGDHCNGIFVFLGDGTGQWTRVTDGLHPDLGGRKPGEVSVGSECIALGDLNADGALDIAAGSIDEGGLYVFLGNGSGREWAELPRGQLPASGWVHRVAIADINGDHAMDIAATMHNGPRVFLGDAAGNFRPASIGLPPEPMIQGLYTGLALGDLNEDGRVDLATANWVDGPEVYLQQADGSWLKAGKVFAEMTGGAVGVAMGDLDRDGHLDLVVSGRLRWNDLGNVYGVSLLRGDGSGGWTYVPNTGLPSTGMALNWGCAVADVNNDGVADVAVASGGITATVPNMREPNPVERLAVWTGQLVGRN